MDLKALREEAIEATGRFFAEHRDVVPDQDSEEWEAEYRRQFELAKKRAAAQLRAPARAVPAGPAEDNLPELRGAPAQQRWAMTVRTARLRAIPNKELRGWLAGAWTSAKDWVDTRDLALPAFLRRVETEYADHRWKADAQARAARAEQQSKAVAAAAAQRRVQAAGITAKGLVELIDVCPRAAAAPIKAKLAELEIEGRSLRVFETANASVLLVIENRKDGRTDYGIERDEGLVRDLKLFAQQEPE